MGYSHSREKNGTLLILVSSITCLVTHVATTLDMYRGVGGATARLHVIIALAAISLILALANSGVCLLEKHTKLAASFLTNALLLLAVVVIDVVKCLTYYLRSKVAGPHLDTHLVALLCLAAAVGIINIIYVIQTIRRLKVISEEESLGLCAGYKLREEQLLSHINHKQDKLREERLLSHIDHEQGETWWSYDNTHVV